MALEDFKVLIVGADVFGHETQVGQCFSSYSYGVYDYPLTNRAQVYSTGEFPSLIGSDLTQTTIDYARDNGFDAIIHSYTLTDSEIALAEANPDIMIFVPTSTEGNDSLQQLVVTDCASQETGGTHEFLDEDNSWWDSHYSHVDSYSNAAIASKLFMIALERNCSLQEARVCANATKDEDNIIDVDLAIAYSGSTALTVGGITVERTGTLAVNIDIDRVTDATNYEIKVVELHSGELVDTIETTTLDNDYTLPNYGVYLFSYRGHNNDLYSDWSDTVQGGQVAFQFFLVQEETVAFGLAVSDYNLDTGTYGNMIKLNIKDNLPYNVLWVQGENSSGARSEVFDTEVSLATLMGYMESSSCPDIAWSLNGQELSIFFKTDQYDTRFAYEEQRHPKALVNTTDTIDIPEDLIPLYRLYVMRSIQNLRGYNGDKLSSSISTEESNFTTS